MTDSTCPFCEIVREADPYARVLFRDENVTAFFPLKPATRGHTLLVPNRHVGTLTGLTPEESRDLGEALHRTAQAIQLSLAPEGMNIIQSTGAVATQTIPHVHFHVVPRTAGDRMELAWPDDEAEDGPHQDRTLAAIGSSLAPKSHGIAPEDRRQHLSFIQAVITRMSQASSSSKTWLLPIVTLTFGYAFTKHSTVAAILGVAAVLIFGLLDANYLKQERAFRKLYDSVAAGSALPSFSMNPTLAAPSGSTSNYWPDGDDLRSWAIAPVYGPLLVAGIAIAAWANCS